MVDLAKGITRLDYSKKRKFQKLMFPVGLLFSLEKKQNLISKTSLIFELTNYFSMNYRKIKERTNQQKANKSVLVPGAGVEPARFPTGV